MCSVKEGCSVPYDPHDCGSFAFMRLLRKKRGLPPRKKRGLPPRRYHKNPTTLESKTFDIEALSAHRLNERIESLDSISILHAVVDNSILHSHRDHHWRPSQGTQRHGRRPPSDHHTEPSIFPWIGLLFAPISYYVASVCSELLIVRTDTTLVYDRRASHV